MKIFFSLFLFLALALSSFFYCKPAAKKKTAQEAAMPGATSEDAALTGSSTVLNSCPKMLFVDPAKNSMRSTPTYMYQNSCWYFTDENQSCSELCKNYYGLDSSGMKNIINNPTMCYEIIKGINPQQANKYLVGAKTLSPAGSACSWVITGKMPNLVWSMVSQSSFNSLSKAAKSKQVCACDTEGFPNVSGLGLSFRGAAATSGKVGTAMLVKPTFLTPKTTYTGVIGPIQCDADPSTPLLSGLRFEQGTCNIVGTPTAPTTGAQKFKVYAYDQGRANGHPNYQSNAAYVSLTVVN